ncbi:hypothetical protein Corgl_0017 [Coriobacterium glomerans PW2]|uniref:Uncharacterized protein n=1 Tax=Coriobacterium glomerans (strain ATCC 49209 / DSM 20642 / JCM 10262 / PW2) TaxID=700015 RepID=F2N6U8_CORGP|nr:hypothetical protein [Coriobacterium glomerans]AEB06147.1 hypothetical protein Corgl_0017 [Coriobacterium glomerans PW2]
MRLPVTLDFSYELRDWRRYTNMREGRFCQPATLLVVVGMPVCMIGVWLPYARDPHVFSSPFDVLAITAAMVAVSVPSGVFGVLPGPGGTRKTALPFFIRHGWEPGSSPLAFRQIVEIDEEGVRLRCGPAGCRTQDMKTISLPWSMWCPARIWRGSIAMLAWREQAGRIDNIMSKAMVFHGNEARLYEEVYIPARALTGISARELRREMNRLVRARRRPRTSRWRVQLD